MRGMTIIFVVKALMKYFNPHPPMRGMTSGYLTKGDKNMNFNPHPPMRGMTNRGKRVSITLRISIHIPLCGG